MPVSSTPLARELDVARQLAREAGSVLLRYLGRHGEVDRKDRNEPVTVADREANELIVRGIRRAFPDDWVLSEEEPDAPGRLAARRVWMVDPMDGTQDFIDGETGFSVMIGLCLESRPVLGVVYRPATGTLYHAARGGGAYVDDRAARVSPAAELRGVRLVASYSHRAPVLDRIREAVGAADEMNIGSVGLKVGLVADGTRDLYVNPSGRSKLWDACAPQAILEEAGGALSDLDGRPLRYGEAELQNLRGLIASNGRLHAQVVSRLAPLFAEGAGARGG